MKKGKNSSAHQTRRDCSIEEKKKQNQRKLTATAQIVLDGRIDEKRDEIRGNTE